MAANQTVARMPKGEKLRNEESICILDPRYERCARLSKAITKFDNPPNHCYISQVAKRPIRQNRYSNHSNPTAMPKLKDEISKLYYSIGEISEMFNGKRKGLYPGRGQARNSRKQRAPFATPTTAGFATKDA